MAQFNLLPNEVRVIGCLMEKSVVTPEQYPLTLNALTNACNQKSSRNPVLSLSPGVVQSTARELKAKHLVRIEENFKSGVEKFTQIFCNTHLGDMQLAPPQFAVICLLLLRGPQTPGELKARSSRLHAFADNQEVMETLIELMDWEGSPLVVKLPRTPGRRDSEYMHLLAGPIDLDAYATEMQAISNQRGEEKIDASALEERVSQLEADVAALKEQLNG